MMNIRNSSRFLVSPKLYNRYSGILNLTDVSLFLIDNEYNIVHELIPSPDFCNHICFPSNKKLCHSYRSRIDSKSYGCYTCPNGLKNIIVPIVVNNEVIGYVGGLKAYLEGEEYKKHTLDVQALQKKNNYELEFIAKSINSLKVLNQKKIEVHEQLCNHIANNIALDIEKMIHQKDPQVDRLSIEKEILERKVIDLETKNMSLVVNPHFLFNTLNCIARIAYFEESKTTEELIYCLSDLLRYNLRNSEQLHTIQSEINNIEKYLYIQKMRFKNRLSYAIHLSEEVKAYRVPNMIIQPIVENAIMHGISKNRDGGKITVDYEFVEENSISILVSDNGSGFPDKIIEDVRSQKFDKGLGLGSVDHRIKQYYGRQYGIEITKSDFTGSTVAIHISAQPLRSELNV